MLRLRHRCSAMTGADHQFSRSVVLWVAALSSKNSHRRTKHKSGIAFQKCPAMQWSPRTLRAQWKTCLSSCNLTAAAATEDSEERFYNVASMAIAGIAVRKPERGRIAQEACPKRVHPEVIQPLTGSNPEFCTACSPAEAVSRDARQGKISSNIASSVRTLSQLSLHLPQIL